MKRKAGIIVIAVLLVGLFSACDGMVILTDDLSGNSWEGRIDALGLAGMDMEFRFLTKTTGEYLERVDVLGGAVTDNTKKYSFTYTWDFNAMTGTMNVPNSDAYQWRKFEIDRANNLIMIDNSGIRYECTLKKN